MGIPISLSNLGAIPSKSILIISVVQVPIQTITLGFLSCFICKQRRFSSL